MHVHNIYLGYWYQRTTLHLSEVYDFLKDASSPLDLDKHKLRKLHTALAIELVEMHIDVFEYIELQSANGVSVRMYEDGLVVFEKNGIDKVKEDMNALHDYFEQAFSPAMSYLFSLGAPVPKELANIDTISPYFVVIEEAAEKDIEKIFHTVGVSKYYEVKGKDVSLFRGGNVFIISPEKKKFVYTRELIEMQIFFREFKVQLHRYLNLHRIIWEKIAGVKEQGEIRGRDVEELRNNLEGYKKTIQLIDGRIEQMGTHMSTREEIIKTLNWEGFLTQVLQFKYETLGGTLSYIKSLWKMTQNYVDSAIAIFSDIQASSTKDSVRALTAITTIGVIAGIMRLVTVDELPDITGPGALYFAIVLIVAIIANKFVKSFYKNQKYTIHNIKASRNIK